MAAVILTGKERDCFMAAIAYEKVVLPNGLEVILHEDHSIPLAAVNVWYHVGSKDEEPGRTGFAHLFEHVMFEGSQHHNSSYFEPAAKSGGEPERLDQFGSHQLLGGCAVELSGTGFVAGVGPDGVSAGGVGSAAV